MSTQKNEPRALALGISCYVIWGFFPLYFSRLAPAGAVEVIVHRAVWGLFFCLAALAVTGSLGKVRALIADRGALWRLAVAGALVVVNWSVYVYAVLAGHTTDAAIGYFINPLVTIALGLIVLRERITPIQKIALGLGALAVLILVVVLPPHAYPTWRWALVVPIFLLQVLLSLGLTFVTSRITTMIPDMRNIWPFLTQFWFYGSGIFFSYDRFIDHPAILQAMDLNPGYLVVSMYRDVILYRTIPETRMWVILVAWAVGLSAVGYVFFWEKEESYGAER